jgi:hypothetical protein
MHGLTTQHGMRRVLDALGKLASELEAEKSMPAAVTDWRSSFIEGQRNVTRHYRRVLATQKMPPGERQALLERIKRVEDEVRALEMGEMDRRKLEAA